MSLDVLNCKLGDLKLSFDKGNPVELERARRAVKKMMRDGFVIFVEVDGKLRRVDDFDETCDCYLITDVPQQVPVDTAPAASQQETDDAGASGATEPPKQRGKRGRPPKQRVHADKHKATAIAPRAGG
jgi:hypothetical protein